MKISGVKPALATDADADCITTISNTFLYTDADLWTGDIRELLRDDYLSAYRGTELVIGGPPAVRGHSAAGKVSPYDPGAEMVFRFMDAVSQIRPQAFLMENSPVLAGPSWSLALEMLLSRAEKLGYATEVKILDAGNYGVAQKRKRMFLFGTPPGTSVRLPAKLPPVTAMEALSPGHLMQKPDDYPAPASISLAKRPVLRKSPYAGLLVNGAGRVIDLRKPSPVISPGGSSAHIIDLDQYHRGTTPWIEEYHAALMAGEPPLKAIPPHVNIRRLSSREAAALQGFSPVYPFCGNAVSVWRQTGNAVPPGLGHAAVSGLLSTLT